jgi:hypothetical protein
MSGLMGDHELRVRIRELEAALRKIVSDGDYTAPEGMKRIAKKALLAYVNQDEGYERLKAALLIIANEEGTIRKVTLRNRP